MPNTQLTNGAPVTPEALEVNPETGQQKAYVVLTPEERAKGFVRPVRTSYIHVGNKPKYPLVPLTEAQKGQYAEEGYVYYEKYPESEAPKVGRYWTEEELKPGCNTVTTMGLSIAETYAREPYFYGSTFCCYCRKHFPVSQFRWTTDPDQAVGS